MTNATFSADPKFQTACEKARIPPTAAQASKYRRGYGAAYNAERDRPASSMVDLKTNPEAMDAQRARCGIKPQEYGPYAPKGMCNTAPMPKKK